MLREFIKYWTTKSSRAARDYGYLYASIALSERARRVGSSWVPHIQQCHKLILSHIPNEPSTVAILGSGLLLEIPIDKLLTDGHRVLLVDMVHPNEVRVRYEKHPQVRLIEMDLSGYVGATDLSFRPPIIDISADVWVSANLLSQMPLEPVRHYQKQLQCGPSDVRLKVLTDKIAREHWQWFKKLRGKKILYTDVERIYRNPEGLEIERVSSIVPKFDIPPTTEWLWSICPLGEDSKNYAFDMRVVAFVF